MTAATPKFSIIVPMYNVEAFLPECVESIRNQTLSGIEIILVDDGSPDRCGELADGYAKKDDRIKVVHRANGGLGPARNSGIEVATGEYVGFVDSDDWVEPDMYERLYQAAVACRADIVFTGLKMVRHGEADAVLEHPFAGNTLRGSDEIFELRRGFFGAPPARVKDEPVIVSVCAGGYRREFLENNGLRFLHIRSEDKFFNTYVFRAAEVVTCISGTPYCYRKDDQPSITKSFDRKTMDSYFKLFRLLMKVADEEPPEYWVDSQLRARRCVIDYTRVLIRTIEGSKESDSSKAAYVAEVLRQQPLQDALCKYPWWKLPAGQAAFYLALRLGSPQVVRCLTRLRRERS